MRLYQIYKQAGGKRVFVGRVAAASPEDAQRLVPTPGEGERYDAPLECTDPGEYAAAIAEYENKAAREHLPDVRGELRDIINGLRETLREMSAGAKQE